jgi:hypothetical protein
MIEAIFQLKFYLVNDIIINYICLSNFYNMPQTAIIKTKTTSATTPKKDLSVKPKTTFREDFDNALTIEEARALSLKHVRSLWKK